LSQTLNLADFSAFMPQHVDHRKCCWQSSTVDVNSTHRAR